jgi:hypothetical protein
MFLTLARLLKNYPSFSSDVKQWKHLSHKLHLLVTLKYFGSEGNASSISHVKDGLGIGKGSVLNYVERTVTALLTFQKRSIFWPSAAERQVISERFKQEFFSPKVVGTVDGTHLGLATKPSLYGEDYFTQKSKYAVVAMVVNDDKKRICYLNIGWPASVHDERVWSNTTIARKPDNYFSPGEYLLADSAFSNRHYLVPAYKKLGNQCELLKDQMVFSKALAAACVRSEHTIGIWKGRFPWLRSIPMRISNKQSMRRLIRYVRATAILHNFFVEHNPPSNWIDPDDRDDQFLNNLNYLSGNMTRQQGELGNRRREVLNYLKEIIEF